MAEGTEIDEKVEGERTEAVFFGDASITHVLCNEEARATAKGTRGKTQDGSVDHELKVGAAYAVLAVVLDVLRPRLALHVDEDASLGPQELDKHEGRQVARSVLVREVEILDAVAGEVRQRAHALHIGHVLSLASDVDVVRVVVVLDIVWKLLWV